MPSGSATRELQVFDPLLTEVARQYKPTGHIYDLIAPHIPVETISGQYPVYDERYFFADDVESLTADRGVTKILPIFWSTDTYLCEDHTLGVDITPRER